MTPPGPGPGREWFAEGIRFSCTGSGKCCRIHGAYAYVFLNREEERALAEHLGLPLREFRRRHTYRLAGGQRSLRFPDGRCTFLVGSRCGVYEARPQQCRTWPFWEENLDPVVWKREVARFCPGVGQGRLYSSEAIRAVRDGRAEAGEEPPPGGDGPPATG